MRKLNIIRKKKMVAALGKIYIYIDNENTKQLEIEKTEIANLVSLKNGASTTIDITEEDTTLYIIFDKFFPQRFNTRYEIESGKEDITLDTYAKYNPRNGHPFLVERK